jgi:NhaP-type Na+/H+ or K+/H+ antiporter
MDANIIIIALAITILGSYLFDLIGKRVKIPSVVLLIGTGILLGELARVVEFTIPYADTFLSTFGTVGLILIVLEGALDLNLTRDRLPLIGKTLLSAVAIMAVTITGISWLLVYLFEVGVNQAIINAIPVSIISSAVAIPAAAGLMKKDKEFVVYESSFSDIIGIVLFNYFTVHSEVSVGTTFMEIRNLLLIVLVAVVLSLFVGYFIDKVTHHVKFVPILAFLLLAYGFGKYYHLSPLLLILIFGLILNNFLLLLRGPLVDLVNVTRMKTDMTQFKQLVAEAVFFARTFFFILFGYEADIYQMTDSETLLVGGVIFMIIVLVRIGGLLAIVPKDMNPLVFFAPRGLITILLFLSIPAESAMPIMNEGLLLIVIFLSLILLILGNRFAGKGDESGSPAHQCR